MAIYSLLLYCFILLLYFTPGCLSIFLSNNIHQERDVVDLIKFDGYPVEIHNVVTEDGYILELHRIPHGRNETSVKTGVQKPVVYLAHCLMCSSAAFVVLGPNGGLAYMLANSGYDVWLLNARGTKYSRKHSTLSPNSKFFWKFSWHEVGIYDNPASIDYILNVTGETQVDAIGFSMGTAHLVCFLCVKPEYNKKLRSLTLMAPAVFVEKSQTPLTKLLEIFGNIIIDIGASTGSLEIFGKSSGMKNLFSQICYVNRMICDWALSFIVGSSKSNHNLDKRVLPFYLKYFPEATSLRTFIHFYQNFQTGKFQSYDFGPTMNKRIYKSLWPTHYNLSHVTAPTNLMWSRGDGVTVAEDVIKLFDMFPNIKSSVEVSDKSYTHLDFIWSKTAHIVVNKEILRMLKI